MQYYNLIPVGLAALMALMLVDPARGQGPTRPIVERFPPRPWVCPNGQPQAFCSRNLELQSDKKSREGYLPAKQIGLTGAPDNRAIWDCHDLVFDGQIAQHGVCCSNKYKFVNAPRGNYTVVLSSELSNPKGANCKYFSVQYVQTSS